MKVYISLPISGRGIDKAREHADMVAAQLSRRGHTPVNPFAIYAGKNPTYADHLCSDLRALMDCDAIYLCEGWHSSRGCRIEAKVAAEFGLERLRETPGEAGPGGEIGFDGIIVAGKVYELVPEPALGRCTGCDFEPSAGYGCSLVGSCASRHTVYRFSPGLTEKLNEG